MATLGGKDLRAGMYHLLYHAKELNPISLKGVGWWKSQKFLFSFKEHITSFEIDAVTTSIYVPCAPCCQWYNTKKMISFISE